MTILERKFWDLFWDPIFFSFFKIWASISSMFFIIIIIIILIFSFLLKNVLLLFPMRL